MRNTPKIPLFAVLVIACVAALSFPASSQTVIQTTERIQTPTAPHAERSGTPIVYWMLLDTSGSMTEERVARAQQTYYEVERNLRSGLDEIRVYGFPERDFAHCQGDAPISEHTGLSRPTSRGERPIVEIGRADVDQMRHGVGQSQTTPLWPAVAELLHEIRATIAQGEAARHRLLVVTDRGCDEEHCTNRHPEPDLDDLDCHDLDEENLRLLLPSLAREELLGAGVNRR